MDTTLIHADIFFYITSIVVLALGIFALISFVYIVKILRSVSLLMSKVKEEGQNIVDDVSLIREKIKEEGSKFAGLGSAAKAFFLGKTIFNVLSKKKKTAKKARTTEEAQ